MVFEKQDIFINMDNLKNINTFFRLKNNFSMDGHKELHPTRHSNSYVYMCAHKSTCHQFLITPSDDRRALMWSWQLPRHACCLFIFGWLTWLNACLLYADIDECTQAQSHPCYGKCTNRDGSFDCSCPWGTQGNATLLNGCVKSMNLGEYHSQHFSLVGLRCVHKLSLC